MGHVDVSVIIVNWNTRQLLLDAVSSIYESTHAVSFEILVVDNYSSDGSPEAVGKAFPGVRLICNDDNHGFSKANNIGIRVSNGRYVCLVNSDTKTLDGCLDKMVHYMDLHPEVGVLGPKTLNGDMSLRKNCQRLPTLWNRFCHAMYLHKIFPNVPFFENVFMIHFDHQSTIECQSLPGCYLMLRREAMDQVGLLDEAYFIYAEDKDWCKRFSDADWKIVFLHEAEAVHYAKRSSAAAPVRFILEKCKADFYYWKKHHSWISNQIMYLIFLLHQIIRITGWSLLYICRPRKREELGMALKGAFSSIGYFFRYKFGLTK